MEKLKVQEPEVIQLKQLQHLKIHEDNIMEICFTNDYKLFASCAKDKSVKLFSFQEDKLTEIQHLKNFHESGIRRILFTSDNQFAITCSLDGSIKVLEIKNNDENKQLMLQEIHYLKQVHQEMIIAMNISKNNQLLATGSKDKAIKFFNLTNLKTEIKEICCLQDAHESIVVTIDFSPNDKFICSGCFDGSLQIFYLVKDQNNNNNLITAKSLHYLKGLHSQCVIKVKILPEIINGKEKNLFWTKYKIVTGSFDKSIKILEYSVFSNNFESDSKLEILKQFNNYSTDEIWNINYFFRCKKEDNYLYLLSGGKDKSIQLSKFYKESNELEKYTYFPNLHEDGVICMVLSKDNDYLVSSSFDGSIKLFKLNLN